MCSFIGLVVLVTQDCRPLLSVHPQKHWTVPISSTIKAQPKCLQEPQTSMLSGTSSWTALRSLSGHILPSPRNQGDPAQIVCWSRRPPRSRAPVLGQYTLPFLLRILAPQVQANMPFSQRSLVEIGQHFPVSGSSQFLRAMGCS